MTAAWLRTVFLRELATLRGQVEAYSADEDLWREVPGIRNLGGSLVLHLCGNLRHFIGGVLGGDGYERDRPGEFSTRDVSRITLLAAVDTTREAVTAAFAAIDDASLSRPYPMEIGERRLPTGLVLQQFYGHLAYHLGQLDYHRRVVTGRAEAVPALSLLELTAE